MHMALFRGENIAKFKCRFQGHRIASGFIAMGLLKPVVQACVEGTLTRTGFYKCLRARRNTRSYLRKLIDSIEMDRHPYLVSLVAAHVLSRGRGPKFRKKLREANEILIKRGVTPPEVQDQP